MAIPKFTDLLDEYLNAKRGYDEARDNWSGGSGSDFRYFNSYTCDRLDKAKDALNKHMDLADRLNEMGVIDLGAC